MIFRPSLSVKLSSLVLVMMFFSVMVYVVFLLTHTHKQVQRETIAYTKALARITSTLIARPLLTEDYPAIEQGIQHLLGLYGQMRRIEVQRSDMQTIAVAQRSLPGDDDPFAYSESITLPDGTVIGTIQVVMNTLDSSDWVQEHLPEIIGASLIMALLVTCILLFYLRRLVVQPIEALAGQAARIGRGDLTKSIRIQRNDELGLLARIMDSMRTNLKHSYNEIRRQNDVLDQRVAERTAELQEKNQQLAIAHRQLVQSEKMASVGLLAAGVAHEINNPIGYLASNLTTLEEYIDSMDDVIRAYEQQDDFLQEVDHYRQIADVRAAQDIDYIRDDLPDIMSACQDGAHRISDIVADLMGFSSSQNNQWQWTDIHLCLESTLKLIRSEIKNTAILTKDYQTMPKIYCMPSQLNQVFLNLLLNAVQSLEGKGHIKISTASPKDFIEVRISDNGRGIPEESRDKIFDPFYTTKSSENGKKGTGLGLSVSYSIIQKHGGEILLDTTYQEGTCFVVHLPITANKDVKKEEASQTSA